MSPAVQVRRARAPTVEREWLIRLNDDHFGCDLRYRRRAVRARTCRQTEIGVVRVFPAELFGGNRAQVVEFFDETQRVESPHARREVVVQVIPSPRGIGFVHAPSLAAKRAEISPNAIGRALLAAATPIHLPIDLLA